MSLYTFLILVLIGFIYLPADTHANPLLGDSNQQEEAQSTAQQEVGPWDQAAAWIWTKQREFHRALTKEFRKLRGKENVGWALVLMSFLYGILHAAGPGHGKAVLTTYLLTHRSQLKRGIGMGAAAALLQGVTALVLVYGLIGMAGWLPRETETASLWTTRVSFILLALIGLYLFQRALRVLIGAVRRFGHVHDDSHVNKIGAYEDSEKCGCRQGPTAEDIGEKKSDRASAGVVLAIGLRPCSGAVLVLILASVMGLMWHGALAVLAMSTGTAITVIALAVLATKARDWASTLVAHRSPVWTLASSSVGAIGGAVIVVLAVWLFNVSFSYNRGLGM